MAPKKTEGSSKIYKVAIPGHWFKQKQQCSVTKEISPCGNTDWGQALLPQDCLKVGKMLQRQNIWIDLLMLNFKSLFPGRSSKSLSCVLFWLRTVVCKIHIIALLKTSLDMIKWHSKWPWIWEASSSSSAEIFGRALSQNTDLGPQPWHRRPRGQGHAGVVRPDARGLSYL